MKLDVKVRKKISKKLIFGEKAEYYDITVKVGRKKHRFSYLGSEIDVNKIASCINISVFGRKKHE